MRRSHVIVALLVGALLPIGQSAVALASPSAGQDRIRGAGVSHPADDDRRSLQVDAQNTGTTSSMATGHLTFDHHSSVGLNHFTADVGCLRVSATSGTTAVTLSGRIDQGQTASGAPLAGKGYDFTIVSSPKGTQSFSLPTFTSAESTSGTCAGSSKKQVLVTQGWFTVTTT